MNTNWQMCQSERCWRHLIWHCTRPVHFDNRHVYRVTG